LGDEDAGVLAVFDPGEEGRRIADRIADTGLETKMILHTHGHLDHAGGTSELARLLGTEVPVGLHRDELEIYSTLAMQGRMFGLEAENPRCGSSMDSGWSLAV
jgi:glyoxylase-like metal-dependent hydrolase (beta-lactamase superfamily II)